MILWPQLSHTMKEGKVKIRKNRLIIGSLLLFCSVIAEDFVIPKSKKLSTNSLKEHCYNAFIGTLELTPKTAHLVAELQECGFKLLESVAQGNLYKKGGDTLKQADAMQQFLERQERINVLLQEQITFIKTL